MNQNLPQPSPDVPEVFRYWPRAIITKISVILLLRLFPDEWLGIYFSVSYKGYEKVTVYYFLKLP